MNVFRLIINCILDKDTKIPKIQYLSYAVLVSIFFLGKMLHSKKTYGNQNITLFGKQIILVAHCYVLTNLKLLTDTDYHKVIKIS